MATLSELWQGGDFILAESPGRRSRSNGLVNVAGTLESGTVVAWSSGKLVAWTSGAAAGVLIDTVHSNGNDIIAAIVSSKAAVKADLLIYPDGQKTAAVAALAALKIVVIDAPVIADTGGTGGTAPAWLPAGAVAYADFVNGNYFAGGAETTLDAVYGTDALYTFDPATVVAGSGLGTGQGGFLGAFLAALSANCTVVIDAVKNPDAGNVLFGLEFYDNINTYATDYYISSDRVQDYNGSSSYYPDTLDTQADHVRIAATILRGDRLVGSLSGKPTVSVSPAVDGGAIAAASFGYNGGFVRSVTVYPPAADADLPALSALA